MNLSGKFSIFGSGFAAFLAAVVFLGVAPAGAITIDVPCAAGWNWNAQTQTLTCGGATGGPPVCTVTGNVSGALGNSVTLTASCSPAATSWSWVAGQNGSCANGTSSATCAASSSALGSVNYTVTPSNGNGTGSSVGKDVMWLTTVPAAPTNCTLTPNPTSLSAAGPVSLSVSCQGGTPDSYQWSASGVTFTLGANTTANTNGATISATTVFSVVASNAGGSNQAQASVQVGSVGGLSCPGFTKTVLVNWDWGTALTKIDTWQVQNGIGTNGIVVVPFIPTGPADNVVAQISATGFPAPSMENIQTLAISSQPCDLNPAAPGKAQGPSPTVRYVIGVSPKLFNKPTAAELVPGQQYYINIAGRMNVSNTNASGTQTCVPGLNYPFCEVRLSVQKPAGH